MDQNNEPTVPTGMVIPTITGLNKYKRLIKEKAAVSTAILEVTPHKVLELFNVKQYALQEAFLNIVQKYNPDRIVFTKNPPTFCDVYMKVRNYTYIDVYDIIDGFGISSAAHQHAVKKILACGIRGHKDFEQDLLDIISSLSRV
jgi:hypothetical protein